MKLTKLDRVFSLYIRQRDSDENGIGKCICCGKIVHYRDADCGHYVNRKHLSLRWNEINCNLCCRSCNRFDEGNIPGYTIGLQKKYGSDIVEKLLLAKNKTVKFTQFEIDQMTKYYTEKLKEFKKT